MANTPPEYKVLVIGDPGVGKTSLLLRFTENTFTETTNVTIGTGVDFKSRTVTVQGRPVKLDIYDTAGQERFRTITSSYYRGAHGIIVVYDVTDEVSFNNVKQWIEEVRRYARDNVTALLIGNKIDEQDKRVVQTKVAQEFAGSRFIKMVETSAKTPTNVDEAFNLIAREILQQQGGMPAAPASPGTTTLRPDAPSNTGGGKKGGCCN